MPEAVHEGNDKASEAGLDGRRAAICTVGELFGGVERHVLGLLRGLASRGMAPTLLVFHDGELASQARAAQADLFILPGSNLKIFDTVRRLAGILESRGIDVVHVHGYKATVFCTIARRRHRFAMVKTEHGLPEPMAGSRTRAWRDRFYRRVEAIAARAAGASVCYVSRDLQLHHRRAHAGLRTAVIPNGVERMERSGFRRPAELAPGRFNLLIAGRLDLVKGHHVAIEAMAQEAMPPDAHLCIVGDGPRARELEALARSSGVSGRVHAIGFRRDIYDYIAHCDALLMPSLHEGLPYTLLEAMALGVPIVASRVGGLAEVLADGSTALLVEPGNAAALAAAVRRLRSEPALRDSIGARAQSLQREKYSVDAMVQSYLDVYREAWRAMPAP